MSNLVIWHIQNVSLMNFIGNLYRTKTYTRDKSGTSRSHLYISCFIRIYWNNRNQWEVKGRGTCCQDERIIQLEDTVDKLKKRIQELSLCKGKIEMDEDNELFNPILRILDRRRAVADCVSEIRLFFDRNRIPIPQDIDDVFNTTTQSLDEIIRQAALMQEIDLIRVRDDFTYETNARRHWETVAQQNQARIAGIQIANLGIRFLNRQSDSKPTESDS
ncbi:hypothetical protein GLOIN_2v1885507 [Rhizophagus irregularis DAOM 181602=DAOM 197198]|nr:hypothetical protein GLOIN_2v1885507 [Rhizophagus irregularis DAOM 181602=DAOM 197198]